MQGPCAVHTCKNEGTHIFPKNEILRTQWVRAMRLDVVRKPGWPLKKYTYICSEHFKPSDFIYTSPLFEGGQGTKILKKHTVPSIFPWTATQKLPQKADDRTRNKNVTFTKGHLDVPGIELLTFFIDRAKCRSQTLQIGMEKSLRVIDSTQTVKTRHTFTTGKGTSTKQYGHCRCCLKQDTHTVGDIQGMLECFNIELSADPSLSKLLCGDCGEFLQQARKFRDMVAASQRKLLGKPQKCNGEYTWEKTTVKIEYDAEDKYVKETDLEPDVSVPSSNASGGQQITTNLDVLKKYLISDPTISLPIAVREHKEEKVESVFGKSPDGHDDQVPDDGRMEDDGGVSELSDDTDGEIDFEDDNKLTAGQIKLIEKQMDAQLNLQIQENLSTILQNSTIIPFATVNKSDKFECIYCDANYIHFRELKDHVKTHDENSDFKLQSLKMLALKRDPDIILRVDISRMNCRLCDERFATIDDLVEHLVQTHDKTYHTMSRDPPHNVLCFDMSLDCLKCLDCGRVFTHFRGLLMHMNQHYGSFLCAECGSKFMHEHSFKLHMIQKSKRNLPRPQCPVCDATYSRKDHLRRHLKLKHPDVTVMCVRAKPVWK